MPLVLIAIPLCLALVVGLLIGISWIEERVLSPRSIILYVFRSRKVGPDSVEALVAAQSERLLKPL